MTRELSGCAQEQRGSATGSRAPRGPLRAYAHGGHQRSEVSPAMNETTKKNVAPRARRVAGQLDGVSRMIEADRASVDIHLQPASAQAALGQAGTVFLRAFAETRLSGVDAATPGERKQCIDELTEVLARYAGLGRRTHDAG